MVRANQSAVVTLPDGAVMAVQFGSLFDRDAAIVVAHPWLFDGVERATAEPGEKRTVRRAK